MLLGCQLLIKRILYHKSFILILSHLKPVIAYHESFLICETSDYDVDEVEVIEKIDVEECQAHDANLFNLRNDVLKNRPIVPPPALVKGELVDGVIKFLPEKKNNHLMHELWLWTKSLEESLSLKKIQKRSCSKNPIWPI